MQLPGIYVEIKGDYTQLNKDIRASKTLIQSQAKGMSNALNNALSGRQIQGGVNKLVSNLGSLSRSADVTGKTFDKLGVDLGELRKITGVTDKEFASLQSRMLKTSAANAQVRALKQIAKAADLSEKEIKALGKQFNLSKASIEKVTGANKKATKSYTSLGNAVKTAISGIVSFYAVRQLKTLASEATELASVQEAAETKLAAVLKATGNAAGYTAEELGRMAAEMQSVTTVGDEVILNSMSMLATFKQVRGEGFERATAAALDMSAVMDQDLKSSVVQIGKALNDPIKGLSALSRVGVSFTNEQKEQIKVLQESGRMYEAQAIILNELEAEFGGAAKAARHNFKGAVTAADNALGDLKEQIGFTITKNKELIDTAGRFEGVFNNWIAAVARGQEGAEGLDGTFDDLISTLDEVGQEFFERLPGKIDATITAIGNVSTEVVELSGIMGDLAEAAGGWGQLSDLGILGYALWGKSGPLKFIAILKTVNTTLGYFDNSLGDVADKAKETKWAFSDLFDSFNKGWSSRVGALEAVYGHLTDVQGGVKTVFDEFRNFEDYDSPVGEWVSDFDAYIDTVASGAKTVEQTTAEMAKKTTASVCDENKKKLDCEQKLAQERQKLRDKQLQGELAASYELRKVVDAAIEAEEAKNAATIADLDQLMEDEKQLWEGGNEEIVKLNELLVNDLGRIGGEFVNDILGGQIKTAEDLLDSFFDYVWSSASRLIGQLAQNSIIDAIMGSGASGGITFQGLASGSSLLSTAISGGSLLTKGGEYLGLGGGATAITPYVPGAGQIAGTAAVPVTIAGATPGALPSGMGFGYGGSIGTSSTGAGMGVGTGALATIGMALAPVMITALGEAFGTKHDRYDTGAVAKDTGDALEDYTRSMQDSIKSISTATRSEELYTSTLNLGATRVHYMADVLGDSTAQMGLSIDGTVSNFDAMLDATLGYNVAQEDSAAMLWLAKEAVDGTAGALPALQNALMDAGMSSDRAATLALSYATALKELPDEINIDVKVNQEIIDSVSSSSYSTSTGDRVNGISNGGWDYSDWLQENHASGGVMTNPTVFHVGGEAGPEAIVPLHNGPDTLAKMDAKIDALNDRPIIINIQGDGAGLEKFIRVIADDHRVQVNRSGLDPMQGAF